MQRSSGQQRILLHPAALPILVLILLIAASSVRASEITVTAVLNNDDFPLEQAALLTVTVNGGAEAVRPELPQTDGLRFAFRGQNSQMQWINGTTSSSLSFHYLVQGEEEGTYTIGPIRVTVDGKPYASNPITCTVGPPGTPSGRQPSATGNTPPVGGNSSSARLRSGESEKIGFMRITPGKEKFYTGELVPFTVKAFFRKDIHEVRYSPPRFLHNSVILQSLDEQPVRSEELINDQPYITLTWQGSMSAVREGTLSLAMEMDASLLVRARRQQRNNPFGQSFFNDPFLDDFFGRYTRREVKISTPEQTLSAMDLPAAGRPDDFQGAIGSFSLAVAASPLEVKVGDPITLKMVISGYGNFAMVQSPRLMDTNGWKTYPPSDTFDAGDGGGSKKIFEQALVPTSAALSDIPPVLFSYFDPDNEKYVSLISDPLPVTLTDTGSNRDSAAVPDQIQEQPRAAANEAPGNLAPLHTDLGKTVHSLLPLYKNKWFLAVMAGALLCLLLALLLNVRKRILAGNPAKRLHKQVNQQLSVHYRKMEQAIHNRDQDRFCRHCQAAIRMRLGEIWDREPQAITLADLQQRLTPDSPLPDIFTRLEDAGYGGNILDQGDMEDIAHTTRQELERIWTDRWDT